jgi:NADPH:quinone reductase-like Zn-dependent oxidoreductase
MIHTEAWVIHPRRNGEGGAQLCLEELRLPDLGPDEVLVAPLYGCWEGNMSHALRRTPVDICQLRLEDTVVLGNAGVVRVIAMGREVSDLEEGDACVLLPIGTMDRYGYITRVFGYDAAGSVGMLAKRTKLKRFQLYRIPRSCPHKLSQWAATSVRYGTAWDNWKIAFGCYRLQMSERDDPEPWVWGWGGGVVLAELQLAARSGCRVAMFASNDLRLAQIEACGILPIDRRKFPDLQFDAARFDADQAYRERYLTSERLFMRCVNQMTEGRKVAVFIDNIGGPVYRATVRALARQGVITSSGWDQGGTLTTNRIEACTNRQLYVSTHGMRQQEGAAACERMATSDWIPPVPDKVWSWEEIPQLAEQFTNGRIASYFPIFAVNADLA